MFNNLALIVRRPDIDRREFRDHYEDIHAPLALPFMTGLRRYLRNHIEVALDGVEPPFDVLSQFAYESVEKAALMLDVLQSEAGKVILADEATFMNQAKNSFFAIGDAQVVVDGTPAAGDFVKVAVGAKAPEGVDVAGYRKRFAGELLAPLLEAGPTPLRCEVHDALGGPHGEPYDAVAFVWFAKRGYVPGRLADWKPEASNSFLLQVEECVTPI